MWALLVRRRILGVGGVVRGGRARGRGRREDGRLVMLGLRRGRQRLLLKPETRLL